MWKFKCLGLQRKEGGWFSNLKGRAMPSEKHEEMREKLLQIGEALGYECRSSFRKDAMGDAIWLDRKGKRFAGRSLPIAAFEVLTFETAREIRDCIMTLQIIAPALDPDLKRGEKTQILRQKATRIYEHPTQGKRRGSEKVV